MLLVSAKAQDKPLDQSNLPDFSGNWAIDLEKSFSKSERRKVSNYELRVAQKDVEIHLYWNYTIGGRTSKFSELLYADGRKDTVSRTRGSDNFEPWTYETKWKKGKLTRRYYYRGSYPNAGTYIDYQTYELLENGHSLKITTTFRTANVSQGTGTADQTLVFHRL
jgi:hypothetical protein